MNKERRWLKSAIAESAKSSVALPWQRSTRRRPDALKSLAPQARKSNGVAVG